MTPTTSSPKDIVLLWMRSPRTLSELRSKNITLGRDVEEVLDELVADGVLMKRPIAGDVVDFYYRRMDYSPVNVTKKQPRRARATAEVDEEGFVMERESKLPEFASTKEMFDYMIADLSTSYGRALKMLISLETAMMEGQLVSLDEAFCALRETFQVDRDNPRARETMTSVLRHFFKVGIVDRPKRAMYRLNWGAPTNALKSLRGHKEF